MGDRVSIQFKNGDDYSVYLFDHWGGTAFVREAYLYARQLVKERIDNHGMRPLDRFEPDHVMVDFIAGLDNPESCYLTDSINKGDNSDNGHFIIQLPECTVLHENTEFRYI